jgi:TRAP-type transport system small permease protein
MILERIEALVRAASGALAVAAAVGLLAIAVSTTVDVLLRYLAGMPIRGHTEVASLATAVTVAGFFPALFARRANVTIRLAGRLLGARAARWLDVFGSGVAAAFVLLLAWQYVRYARSMTDGGDVTPFLRLAVGPWWWVVAALMAATALVALVVLARDAEKAWTR